MMNDIFSTYARHLIFKSFYISSLVWVVMVFLDLSITLVMELENLSPSNNFSLLLYTVLMEQPHKGIDYLESSVLIGTLIALTLFNQQGNLVLLRSLGFSPAKIVLISGIGPLILSATILLADDLLFVGIAQEAGKNQSPHLESSSSLDQKYSWQFQDQTLIGLELINPSEIKKIQVVQFGKQGEITRSDQYEEGVLIGNKLIISPFEEFEYRSTLDVASVGLKIFSLRSLVALKKDYKMQGSLSDLKLIQAAIFEKIFIPISIIAIIFLAGSLMFGAARSGGVGKQIVLGIFIGLIYDLIKDLSAASFLTYQWPILLGYLLPICLLILAGSILYRRI